MTLISSIGLALIHSNSDIASAATDAAPENLRADSPTEGIDSVSDSVISGSKRYVVWFDDTPGNFDIFFKRTLDSGATWKPTVNLSTNPGDSDTPRIATSGSNVYVTWTQLDSAGEPYDVFFRRSTDSGATWGPKVKLSTGTYVQPVSDLSTTGSNVFVVWSDHTFSSDVTFRRSTDGGVSWKSPVNISDFAGDSHNARLAVSGSNIYVAWDDSNHDLSVNDVLFRRSTDNGGSWKPIQELDAQGASGAEAPELVAAGSYVYLVWAQDPTFFDYSDIYFRKSTNNGAAWSTAKNLSTNEGPSFHPRIASAGSTIGITWVQGNVDFTSFNVFYRGSTDSGSNWGSKLKISSSSASSIEIANLAMSGSNVYVAWDAHAAGDFDISIRRSTDSGATWKPILNLSNNGGDSHGPKLSADGALVFVIWFDKTPGNYDILTRASTNSGATWSSIRNLSNNSGDSLFEYAE